MEWNTVPDASQWKRIVSPQKDAFEIQMLEPEVEVITIDRAAIRQARLERRAQANETFLRRFPEIVRDESCGNYSRMARRLGVAPSVVGRWAHGKIVPSVQNLIVFCLEYDYTLADLYTDPLT